MNIWNGMVLTETIFPIYTLVLECVLRPIDPDPTVFFKTDILSDWNINKSNNNTNSIDSNSLSSNTNYTQQMPRQFIIPNSFKVPTQSDVHFISSLTFKVIMQVTNPSK